MKLDIIMSSHNLIDTKISHKKTISAVSSVYDPPQTENRALFWKLLELHFANRDEAWLLTGDFNELLTNEEKQGGPERRKSSFIDFRSCVSRLGLLNVKYSNNSLS